MFKFDNAFLTKSNTVGIQFVDKTIRNTEGEFRKATLYTNSKGQLQGDCSILPLNNQEYRELVSEYNKRKAWYKKH